MAEELQSDGRGKVPTAEEIQSDGPEMVPTSSKASRVSITERQNLLEEIDDLLDLESTKALAHEKLDLLWEHYADGLGFITGEGYNQAISDAQQHVKREWDKRNLSYIKTGKEKLAKALGEWNDVRDEWVKNRIDRDRDGCITKSELIQGLSECVNEVEPKDDA